MKLDKEAVRRLLALNDAQLQAVIMQLASENGIDASALPFRPSDMASVRRALEMASDDDLRLAAEQIGRMKRRDGR